jgi:hypothetical protein
VPAALDGIMIIQMLACNHDWGQWVVISTKIIARSCTKCGAVQERRR